jgi:hypothetical protein
MSSKQSPGRFFRRQRGQENVDGVRCTYISDLMTTATPQPTSSTRMQTLRLESVECRMDEVVVRFFETMFTKVYASMRYFLFISM